MRLLSFRTKAHPDSQTRVGVIDDQTTGSDLGVIDLSEEFNGSDLLTLIVEDKLTRVRDLLAARTVGAKPDHRFNDLIIERPIAWPGKIFCIGVNYGGRASEYEDKSDASFPSVFVRFGDSLTGHDQPLLRPPESPQLDYEGEIVAIIGKGGRRIPVSEARSHLAGLSLGNEGTIRDWVRHAKFNVTQGKNWISSGSFGPWMITMDEIGPFDDLTITTHVNGEQRQHDSPATMKYSIEYQIHYLSTFTELRPGDIIFTGTPTGAGARFDPPRWLVPGDVIEVTVPGIGTLRNPVEDEPTCPEAGFADRFEAGSD